MTKVLPLLRVVANGSDPQLNRLKATVILSPQLSDVDGAFELSEWPARAATWILDQFAGKASKASLRIARIGEGDISDPHAGDVVERIVMPLSGVHAWPSINALWKACLGKDSQSSWQELANDIEASIKGGGSTETLSRDYTPADSSSERPATDTEFDFDGALLAETPSLSAPPGVSSVLAVKHADFGVDEERRRAIRVWRKLQGGPRACDESPLDTGSNEHDSDKSEITKAEFDKRVRKHHWEQYCKAVHATIEDRGKAADVFEKITAVLSKKSQDCSALDFRDGDCRPVPPQKKADPAKCLEDRASHAYGTWLQRQKKYRYKVDSEGNARPLSAQEISEKAAEPAASDDRQRLLGVFHALQGDRVLSRLFCLAVDIEFPRPATMNGGSATYLHLWIGRGTEGSPATVADPSDGAQRVMTAAKLQRDSFWPVSIFEAGLGTGPTGEPICADLLIEQSDGIWRLGTGANPNDVPPIRAPRYDLASLDIRRAIDSKHDAIDRGERQITAGFTILDRGRAYQVIRELAIAACGAKCSNNALVLYAEDLTIGRRVDVAAVKAGASIDGIEWRSLMHRLVNYHFGDRTTELRRVISALLPKSVQRSGGWLLQEGSFQVAARHVPRIEKNGTQAKTSLWDVTADEAIYSWDGTPAAVLTDGERADDEQTKKLPYKRDYDLPSTDTDRVLLPPPLRYGVPYVFSLRSEFVGGGSPDPIESATYHAQTQGGQMLPPSRNGYVAPRRFLRHESILAPTLLLPKHLATYRYGVMGFEQVDQAIIRTAISTDEGNVRNDEQRREASDGSPYANLASRELPELTMRVFVAPEASFEDVVKHGRLDGKDPVSVLRGGLRDVAYEYSHEARNPGRPRVSGFPSVITDHLESMDAEHALYHRRYVRPEGDGAGVPVFAAGGTNNVPRGDVGWLPDPAAHHFSIRARIRGSDRYLDGDLIADLYDKDIAFPHALPLVLDIRKSSCTRREHGLATSVHELLGGDSKAPLKWLNAAGRVSSPGIGTAVRYLALYLHEGDDYDLEVACLPSEAMLAGAFSLPETMAVQRMQAFSNKGAEADLKAFCGKVDLEVCKGYGHQSVTGIGGNAVPDAAIVRKCAADILATMRNRWPIEEVAAVTKLRICHAINKPTSKPKWASLSVGRPDLPTEANVFSDPGNDKQGTTTMLLTGRIELDLEQIDAFEISADAVGAAGGPIDDATRSRSVISRRSGRWPKMTTLSGERRYVPPKHVVGFEVAANGRVTLPTERVTLLRVDNLPVTRAIGGIVKYGMTVDGCKLEDDAVHRKNPVFEATAQRWTVINLGCLHASAIVRTPIAMTTARPANSQDAAPSTRTIKAAQPHPIADTRARRLMLQIKGISRFAETFETAPVYLNSKEPLLRRRQPLSNKDQAIVSETATIWSPATERPALCEPLRPEPVFVLDRSAEDDCCGGVVHIIQRRVLTRFYFKRGWFSSGEGERLGIVLWPPDYFDRKKHAIDIDSVSINGRSISIADFDDKDLGVGGAFITRWGGDPIRKDERPQNAVLIPTSAFADAEDALGDEFHCSSSVHDPKVVPRALMPVPKAAENGAVGPLAAGAVCDALAASDSGSFLPVCLLTYEPCFDLEREEWYVDVDLRTHRPSEPIVRFGLVRYQPHAITCELSVSNPVTVTVPLLPGRRLEVRATSANATGLRQVEISLAGPGSVGIKDLGIAQTFSGQPKGAVDDFINQFAKLQRPWLRAWLFHESRDKAGLLLRTPLDSEAQFSGWEVLPDVDDDELSWRMTISLPRQWTESCGRGKVIAYVEEVDRRMPATYAQEPIEPAEMFNPDTFVDSGPRFSARVPFLEIASAVAPKINHVRGKSVSRQRRKSRGQERTENGQAEKAQSGSSRGASE